MTHTPGPWMVNTAGSAKKGEAFKITELYVYAPQVQDDTAICADIIDPVTQEPSEANAYLIAAAPDLLEALRETSQALAWREFGECRGFSENFFSPREALEKSCAAIKKATGE